MNRNRIGGEWCRGDVVCLQNGWGGGGAEEGGGCEGGLLL